jgi:hypothetical protein
MAFLAKKTCDVGREFFFLTGLPLTGRVNALTAALEIIGVAILIEGSVGGTLAAYSFAGSIIGIYALRSFASSPWSFSWVVREIPHALEMTLFNMSSRLFLVFVPSPVAHLAIGSVLQVVNFLAPITFSINSRKRLGVVRWLTLLCSSLVIFGVGWLLVAVADGVGPHWSYLFIISFLLAFNASSVIRISAGADRLLRSQLGSSVAAWVIFGTLLARSGLLAWEIAYAVFLCGNAAILVALAAGHKYLPSNK